MLIKIFEGINNSKFSMKSVNVHKGSMTVIYNFEQFFKDNGLDCFIKIGNVDLKNDSLDIEYDEFSDSGKFVNFGGLMVNTESLYVALGYNANSESYIPILDMVQLFNAAIFGEDNGVLGKQEVLYIIESFKLDFRGFDIKKYVQTVVSGVNYTGNFKYSSVILNIVDENVDSSGVPSSKLGAFDVMSNSDICMALLMLLKGALKQIHNFAKEFFGNFISEDDISEVLGKASLAFPKLVELGMYSTKGYENAYLKNIKDRGVSPVFARELSSVGFGLNRRNDIATDPSRDDVRDLALLSSHAYVTAYQKEALNKISDTSIGIYNVLDVMRGLGVDQDLFFSWDVLNELGNETLLEGLIKKLNIELEVKNIGKDKFVEGIKSYATGMLSLLDGGSLYGRKVATGQKSFASFYSRELINAGKLFNKLSTRILSRF